MQFLPMTLARGRQILGIALIFAAAGFAQAPPAKLYDAPPEVIAKLRTRVNDFFQLHTIGSINYRKAFSMVAEDTQDYYFAVQKASYQSFRILSIKFTNPELTNAMVDLEGMQKIQRVEFPGAIVPIPMTTLWKVEDGEWKWYRDITNDQLTPMGHSDLANIQPGDKVSARDLEQLRDPKIVLEMGKKLVGQFTLDKGDVTMPVDKPSSVNLKFHNGKPGTVKLDWFLQVQIEGFKVTVDHAEVPANGDATVTLSFDPPADRLKTGQESTELIMLLIQPFNSSIPIVVRFGDPNAK
jgi:hypothetical protein